MAQKLCLLKTEKSGFARFPGNTKSVIISRYFNLTRRLRGFSVYFNDRMGNSVVFVLQEIWIRRRYLG